METNEALEEFLKAASREAARNKLSNQGVAWSLMRVNGVYNGNAKFVSTISTDLLEFGLSVLRAALALKEGKGEASVIHNSFELAGRTLESLLTNGKREDPDIGFLQVLAACSYHIAGYSAIAFSILNNHEDVNNNQAEMALRFLILRDFLKLRLFVSGQLNDDSANDEHISKAFESGEILYDDVVVKIANVSICRALGLFEFALQTGSVDHVEGSKAILQTVVGLTSKTGHPTLWWVARLTLHLLDDLWEHSLHVNLPLSSPNGGVLYTELRKKFILTLFNRGISEVELWPSQMEAAKRSVDESDDLVVALPTSAGKTRIAEIAALVTLSSAKRIIIVTPLRALSAQTERSFKKTFGPLGYTVSSLYGAIGMSSDDQNALKEKSIVIATPEKLDFALRNDPSLLDDVGLLILDEGHMVGPTEREIRYEILVQRLLRRPDADSRRIVCLSAILPDGDDLNNFTQWLRSDAPGSPVRFPWRPTRQRFGVLTWEGQNATLNFDYKNEIPFITQFLTVRQPRGRDRNQRPRNLNEKTIFTAWKFASQGKRVLIFITQANWVESYGSNAIDLVEKGYLDSLLSDRNEVQQAISVGEEWLGKDHPAVKALEIGLAIHHGGLPNPFLRELESLLSKGIIKVTAASPTLSQGLNINAAILLVPYLYRAGTPIRGEEFANVAGRAGRAFVDVEGFVIHMIDGQTVRRRREWERLVNAARHRTLASGLYIVIATVFQKLASSMDLTQESSFEYLAGNRDAWFASATEDTNVEQDEMNSTAFLIEKLDATVFGLISALESNAGDLAHQLEEALKGSLWAREVEVLAERTKQIQLQILTARARLIWSGTTANVRRGHFAMGVGFDTGLAIDQQADKLEALMDAANEAAIGGKLSDLTTALIKLAERLLVLRPFMPSMDLPTEWKVLLRQWVSGTGVEDIGSENMPFIEEAFNYRMIWALEAIRMRRIAHGWEADHTSSAAAACLENGVPRFMMAMLIRSGLPSRIAAQIAVKDGEGDFTDTISMAIWLSGRKIRSLDKAHTWPTVETRSIWSQFYSEVFSGSASAWTLEEKIIRIKSESFSDLEDGEYRVMMKSNEMFLYAPDFAPVISIKVKFRQPHPGVLKATVKRSENVIHLERFGPGVFEDVVS